MIYYLRILITKTINFQLIYISINKTIYTTRKFVEFFFIVLYYNLLHFNFILLSQV